MHQTCVSAMEVFVKDWSRFSLSVSLVLLLLVDFSPGFFLLLLIAAIPAVLIPTTLVVSLPGVNLTSLYDQRCLFLVNRYAEWRIVCERVKCDCFFLFCGGGKTSETRETTRARQEIRQETTRDEKRREERREKGREGNQKKFLLLACLARMTKPPSETTKEYR